MRRLFILATLLLTGLSVEAQTERIGPYLNQVTLQYAGSIGQYSVGVGRVWARSRLYTGVHVGYVPEGAGGPLTILSGKFEYRPFDIDLARGFSWRPVNPGFFASYSLGDRFWLRQPSNQYPADYYWFSTGLRLHPSLSTAVDFDLHAQNPQTRIHKLSLYLEANTNDLYLHTWYKDQRALSFGDIVFLGTGVRALL